MSIRWGMIGCGSVAERKSAPAYQQVAGFELAAVSSRTVASARDYAARHGVELVFDDPEELIASPAIDAVYIATPPSSHFGLALLAARARKPCSVEKPMAMSHAEATGMMDAFATAGMPLFVAYYRRSLPRFVTLRKLVADGCIGDVRHAHWTLTRSPSPADKAGSANWRTERAEAPGGYFDDLACHGLDLLDFVISPLAEVGGVSTNQAGLYGVPDASAAAWLHSCGATGSAVWNFASHDRADEVRIIGSSGEIRFSIFEDEPLTVRTSSGDRSFAIANPDPIQLPHVENIRRHLEGDGAHPSLAESAARTAWVMERILER